MGQEDTENKINFECLRTMVDEAIKTKNICIIDRIEDEKQLRYIQKYAEALISKHESRNSSDSFFISIFALAASLFIAGVSVYLTGDLSSIPKITFTIIGVFIMAFGIIAILKAVILHKEFEKSGKNAEFMHEIVLKIEEKLSDRT